MIVRMWVQEPTFVKDILGTHSLCTQEVQESQYHIVKSGVIVIFITGWKIESVN